MTTQTKKRVAWALMSGGIGAALLFVVTMSLEDRWPRARDWWMYLWPSGGLILGVAGWVWSRRLYRAEPPQPPATWTVTLSDLILATVFAGFCSAILMGMDHYRGLVPVAGMLGFVLYMHGALAASLQGVFGAWRIPFAAANLGLTLGAMGLMTMGLVSVLIIGNGESNFLIRFWFDVILPQRWDDWIVMIRVCVYAWPVGAVLMALVKWRMAESGGDGLLRP